MFDGEYFMNSAEARAQFQVYPELDSHQIKVQNFPSLSILY